MPAPTGGNVLSIMLRTLRTLLPLAVAVSLAGCGTSGGDDDAGEVLYNAAQRTASAKGVHLDLTMAAQGQEIHMAGFEDIAGKRGRFTMTMPEVGDVQLVSDGDRYYFRYPPQVRRGLGIDTEWASADTDAVGGSVFGNSTGFDASQLLAQMSTAGDVERVGEETVDGVPATKYHATIDLRKVPDTVPADQREAAQKTLDKGLDAGVEPNVPLDVWVDDDSHVRRVEEQLEVAGQTIDVTLVLADFGAHEEITVPPKATDITDKLDD